MLSICLKGKEITWHYSEPLSFSDLGNEEVLAVQADGDELDWIRSYFSNIPMHDGRLVTWTGEAAMFIVHTIIMKCKQKV